MSDGLCSALGVCLNVHTLLWLERWQLDLACSFRHLQACAISTPRTTVVISTKVAFI